ncbi:hypothetical protein SUDANB60_01052 [Streptomyces sp. enrichment culture]
MPGDPVVLLAERDPEVPYVGAREHPQPHQADVPGLCPVHPHDRPGDRDGDGGLRSLVAAAGLDERGQVAGRELHGTGGRAALGHPGRRRPVHADPGALGPPHQGDEGLGELVADARADGGGEGVHGAGGPPVVDGLAGGVQGVEQTHGQRAAGGDGHEGGEAAAVRRGAHQHALQRRGGRAPVAGAVVAGTGAGGERGGEQGAAGGGPQLFLRGPGDGVAGPGRQVAGPADLVTGDGEGEQDLAGGGRAAAGQRVQGLGEQVLAVGEGTAGRHEQAGAGARAGRGPPAVATGGAAAPLPAVPAQQGGEHGGVGAGGLGRLCVGEGVGGVRAGGPGGLPGGAVGHGLPPLPTRVMISHSARSSKMREVGIRTVVRRRPVTGCPARLTQ